MVKDTLALYTAPGKPELMVQHAEAGTDPDGRPRAGSFDERHPRRPAHRQSERGERPYCREPLCPAPTAPASGTLTFNPGQTSATVTVDVAGDTDDEPAETFYVNLSSPASTSVVDGQAQVTVNDNDPVPAGAPTASVSDSSLTEGDSSVYASFVVTLSAPSTGTVWVNFANGTAGTATLGADYAAKTATLMFSSGQTSKRFTIEVLGDTEDEPSELFYVNLSSPIGASLGDSQGAATVLDNDPAPADAPTVSVSDVTTTEGASGSVFPAFTVTLSAASTRTILVDFANGTGGTATVASDYLAKTGTITFSPGQTSKTFTIEVAHDTDDEPAESFFVNLPSRST